MDDEGVDEERGGNIAWQTCAHGFHSISLSRLWKFVRRETMGWSGSE